MVVGGPLAVVVVPATVVALPVVEAGEVGADVARVVGGSMCSIRIDNRSGYRTSDLEAFLSRGARAMRIQGRLHVTVVPSPIRSRGCAEIGGTRMVLAIAFPENFSLRRLARLYEHELAHIKGIDHGRMNERLLYSLGPVPKWAVGSRIRWADRS